MEKNNLKRKRNKNYFERRKARKYERQGKFGRGAPVDEEIYQYFMKIFEMNVENIKDEEERETIANNTLLQIKGEEVRYSSNQFVSKVIENLLPFASNEVLDNFIDAFNDLRRLCTDNFASFVVQVLVKVCAKRFRESDNKKLSDFVAKTSSFIFNNLEEFIYVNYPNQIGRTCVKECSGSVEEIGLSPVLVASLGERMLKWPELIELPNNALTSGFLQILLEGLSVVDHKVAKKMIGKLLKGYFTTPIEEEDTEKNKDDKDDEKCKLQTTTVPEFFENIPSARLLESIIEIARPKTLNKLFLKIFINRLKTLSCNKSSTFAVQKLITSCQEPTMFNAMMTELETAFPEIISAGQMNIIINLAKACVTFSDKHGDFIKALKTVFDIKPNSTTDFILKLIYPNGEQWKKVDLQGSLLLQTLFQFKKPVMVVESFLAVDSHILKEILTDPRGSHLADAFVSSETVGGKNRNRLMIALKDHYKELAMDKHGSRVIDALWSRASVKEKQIIMDQLDRSIGRTVYGQFLSQKLRLDTYLKNKTSWIQSETPSADKVFSKILGKGET